MRRIFKWLGTVLVVIVIGCTGLYFGAMYLLTGQLIPPDYRKMALEGQPIVQAIYEFKLETGLWPHSLDELVPAYLPHDPPGYWDLSWSSLSRHAGMPHTGIVYTFRAPDIGWCSDGDFGRGRISLPTPVTTRPAPTPEEQFKNAMVVLDHRILSNPTDFELHRDKVEYLVHKERRTESIVAAQEAANELPDDWWFPMARAELAEGEFATRAVAEFVDWVDRHPNFNNYWYLFDYYRLHDQPELASTALEQAAAHPVVRSRDYDSYTPDYFCFVAAAYACKLQQSDLTLRICEQWDRMATERGYGGGRDALAIRAAAYLNLGRTGEAREYARRAIEQQERQAGWSGGLDRLNAAAIEGDVDFVYDATIGGSFGAPRSLFVSSDEYE